MFAKTKYCFIRHGKVVPICYLHLCKKIIIYIFRTKDFYISCGSPSAALQFHLYKNKKKRETLEILNAAVIVTGYFAKKICVSFLELWSHCGSLFDTSQTALPSAHCGQLLKLFFTFQIIRSKLREINFIHKNLDNPLQFEGFVTLLLLLFHMTFIMHT